MNAPKLGAAVIREVIKRSGVSPDMIDQTNFENAWQAGNGPNSVLVAARSAEGYASALVMDAV